MDEWEAERDWRDDEASGEGRVDAPAGLLHVTLIFALVALGLAVFVAPSLKQEARALVVRAQSGLDEMATGSILRKDPSRPGSVEQLRQPGVITGSCGFHSPQAGEGRC